jgi:HAUS augmin-like complex subunit 1
MLEKFKNDVEKQQAEQMTDWQTKLVMMDSKERQYILQVSNYKVTSFSSFASGVISIWF